VRWPALDDTIAAVASGFEPAAVGIVRLSGRRAFELLGAVGVRVLPASFPRVSREQLTIDTDLNAPADVFWFRRPRSYTGQDLVELHTLGCPPLVRVLSSRLIEAGARRALPGEFTSRAFLEGKLSPEQVDAVLALVQADDATAARAAARRVRGRADAALAAQVEKLLDLTALIEAGIDFVEEEDVRLISVSDALARLGEIVAELAPLVHETPDQRRDARPHVALAGLPNAGKSSLFNRLIGAERALVSPVIGTTRDVISAEWRLAGLSLVLQDCAGLGDSEDELELAGRLAAERAADIADLVLWVHDPGQPWSATERRVCERLPIERRILAWSKSDDRPPTSEPPIGFAECVRLSARTGAGLDALTRVVARRLPSSGAEGHSCSEDTAAASHFVQAAAREITASGLQSPELIAMELREAVSCLRRTALGSYPDEVLARVFATFCVGK